jgi:transposase
MLASSGSIWRRTYFKPTERVGTVRRFSAGRFPEPSCCHFLRPFTRARLRWKPARVRIIGHGRSAPWAMRCAYVKPFVKRKKNDAADAEAIAEAASRPTMRFVAVKSAEKQASGMAFKTRDLLVRQRTQTINALRGHMAEYGVVAPQGPVHVERLAEALQDPSGGLPAPVISLCQLLLANVAGLTEQIGLLEQELRARARSDQTAKRLMTIPGVGVICAVAIEALAPPLEGFAKGRDFAAWLGLTPQQNSSGGKTRLGGTSKMGQRDLRRLLVSGAMAVVRWASRKGAPEGSWLGRMLKKKPRLVVAVALANRTARIAWALMTKGGVYQAPDAVRA